METQETTMSGSHPIDFYSYLKECQVTSMKLPSDFPVDISDSDRKAAELLIWLHSSMPAGSTYGEMIEVLQQAEWWTNYFASIFAVRLRNNVDK